MSLGKVSIGTPRIKNANFDFGHRSAVVNDFGRMTCIHFKDVIAGTKSTISTASVTRLAPLANPSFGRIMMKIYHQFVSLNSVFPKSAYYLAQLPRLNNAEGLPTTPTRKPTIKGSILNWYLLKYSWIEYFTKDKSSNVWSLWPDLPAIESLFLMFPPSYKRVNFKVVNELKHRFVNISSEKEQNKQHFFAIDSADIVGSCSSGSTNLHRKIACKLTKFSQSLRDAFVACGCKPCWDWSIEYDFTRILALYKAYYDIMLAPIQQYELWDNTACAKLIKYIDQSNGSLNFDWDMDETKKDLLDAFMEELGRMYYTSNVDWLSAHLPIDFMADHVELGLNNFSANSHPLYTLNGGTSEVDETNLINRVDRYISLDPNIRNHSLGEGQTSFSQYQDDWLKKMFLLVNARSQVGYNLKEELKLRGFEDFIRDCESRYIGHSQYLLPISEVISTADTGTNESSNDKRQTGDYSGQSSTSNNGSTFHHVAGERGFVISFCCIVPDQTISNNATDDAMSVDILTDYSELTDSLGYIGTPRIQCGIEDMSEHIDANGYSQMSQVFGIIPRHFGKKISPNLRLGNCANMGERVTWSSMFIDKVLYDHSNIVKPRNENKTATTYTFINDEFDDNVPYTTLVPQAGESWRQFASVPITDQFNKIFYYVGESPVSRISDDKTTLPVGNFITMFHVQHSASSPMLPTSMSFPTYDREDPDHDRNIVVEK